MRIAARLLLAAWVGVVLLITLSPHNTQTQATGDRAVARAERHLDVPGRVPAKVRARQTDVVGNVMLFVPVGLLGVLAFSDRRGVVVASGIALSAGIELFQAVFLPSRTASLQDVATNGVGHLVGVSVAVVAVTLADKYRPRAAT